MNSKTEEWSEKNKINENAATHNVTANWKVYTVHDVQYICTMVRIRVPLNEQDTKYTECHLF